MQFQIHTKETAPEASRATLDATTKKYGFVPNLYGGAEDGVSNCLKNQAG